MPRASRLTCYARDRCPCLTCRMPTNVLVCVILAAPFLLVLGLLVSPLAVVHWLRARARVRRFFRMLRGAEGGSVVICARRYFVVDVRPSRRDEPASALLLHLVVTQPSDAEASEPYHADDGMIRSVIHAAVFAASADLAFSWGTTGRIEPFLMHLTEESLEGAAFDEQTGPGIAPSWGAWMDCTAEVPSRPGVGGLIAALAAARDGQSSGSLPLFSNARTTDVRRPSRFSNAGRLHCPEDVGLFHVGRAPWLSALLLRYDLAARRVQRAWRAAVGDPSGLLN